MKKFNIIIGISIIIHIVILGIFYMEKNYLNVFSLITMMLVPIPINIILSIIGVKTIKANVNPMIMSSILVVVNTVYWIIVNIQLNIGNTLDAIYETSRQYSSNMIEISSDNSPISSTIILILFAFALYYFILRTTKKELQQ